MIYDQRDIDIFWSRVDMSRGPNGCWPWTLYCGTSGYGHMHLRREGHTTTAPVDTHKLAFVFSGGVIPEGQVVRHYECGNPPCCNPAHLRPGTHQENAEDRIRHGRSGNVGKRISESEGQEIWHRHFGGETKLSIATSMGISYGHVRTILRGKVKKHPMPCSSKVERSPDKRETQDRYLSGQPS